MKQITITSLVGLEPFIIYLCDNNYNSCVYIDTITSSEIPYSFNVFGNFSLLSEVGVKVVDSNGCEIKDMVTL